jgi:hypothetical protein
MAEYRRALEKSQQDHGVSAISHGLARHVVRNPWPLQPEIGLQWGNGTSNKAHLIVRFRD